MVAITWPVLNFSNIWIVWKFVQESTAKPFKLSSDYNVQVSYDDTLLGFVIWRYKQEALWPDNSAV